MEKEEERDLIAHAQQGHAESISALYEEHVKAVYRFVFYKVGNTEDAEDITQETLIAAFDGIKNFRGDASFRNWCYEIAKRKTADLWRKKYALPLIDIETIVGMHIEETDNEAQFDILAEQEKKTELVNTLLDGLQKNYKQILHYRFLKNYSIKESAQEMGISVANAKVLQHRALKKIAQLYPEMPQISLNTVNEEK